MTTSTRRRPLASTTAATGREESRDWSPTGWLAWLRRLESPVATYYLLLGSTTMLVIIGLVMVLSASSVESYAANGSSYTVFLNQLEFAVLGIIGAIIASRLSVGFLRKVAPWAFGGAVLLQGLVFSPLGVSVLGNRNWIEIAGQRLQPSEFAKVALVLLGAAILTRKRRQLGKFRHALIPLLVPCGGLLVGLVLLGHDLGTALVLLAIIAGVLFAAGVPLRGFLVAGGSFAALAGALVITSPNRMGRITTWLGSCQNALAQGCFQKVHGEYALADGGWWGVGLGASREKWSWLPEAHNDFIFAIIGEELGLPGTLVVIGLFAVLAFACYRLVLRTDDFFVRIASAGIMVWILVQAIINIGAVIGLLPIIGVPLPLVSSGGSALVTTLVGIGILFSFARNEPGCKEALQARPSMVRRTLAVVSRQRQEDE
ncbi:MAG TPA: putative lipid II flippase FtsW [Segeticoccus sp.]|uniref:putative lipid II flippase FtsW n=1 Tax=Segeticoccus sp. TaxID=2706531 RepID=UPI002D8115F9|nr:putative lipid II flippase FtsW [Segeticoccus sp.]HET8601882.1 putative lipid II flippase FtsW [Segeticoccus sp.]